MINKINLNLSFTILIRLFFIITVSSSFVSIFYYPFISTVYISDINPWDTWISNGGRIDSFPYGLVLLFILIPVFLGDKILINNFSYIPPTFLYGILLIVVDLYIYKYLKKYMNTTASNFYIYSPIVIYINFIYFQTDSIVGLFLLLFCVFLMLHKSRRAGIFLGLSIGSKFGVLLIIPFLAVFAIANRRFRKIILESLIYALPIVGFSYSPYLWSAGFRRMVFGSDKIPELFDLKLNIGSSNFLIFPAIYTILLLWIWKTGHTNLKVLVGFIGTSIFILSIASFKGIGWFLWGLPILFLVLARQKKHLRIMFAALQFLITIHLFSTSVFHNSKNIFQTELISDVILTLIYILSAVWIYSVLKNLLVSSDILKLNSSPLSIAISGDSSVGKDTLSCSIARILGKTSTTLISGDSFHRFEREHGNWKSKTHLNPNQNNLSEWNKVVTLALNRRNFELRKYNHTFGRFTEKNSEIPGDIIISQGLHALYGNLAQNFDLRIFLEMDERIRRIYKIDRDSKSRKQSPEKIKNQIIQRKQDYKKFIEPQKKNADIVITQKGFHPFTAVIDVVVFKFKDYDLANSVFNKILPFINSAHFLEHSTSSFSIKISQVSTISSDTLYRLLINSLDVGEEFYLNKDDFEAGSIGVLTCISILSLEYIRRKKN